VPYLNGGLFEPEKNRETLKLDFPPAFFQELLEFLSSTISPLTKTARTTMK
jgi:hypothetical protein